MFTPTKSVGRPFESDSPYSDTTRSSTDKKRSLLGSPHFSAGDRFISSRTGEPCNNFETKAEIFSLGSCQGFSVEKQDDGDYYQQYNQENQTASGVSDEN
jgi:hypothetical protein